MEFHNKAVRRQWSEARRRADLYRRTKNRKRFVQYCPAPLRPEDTVGLVEEEALVRQRLVESPHGWVKLWGLLNELTHGRGGHVGLTRPRRQAMMALIQRLISEKKIVRHRKSNTITLAFETGWSV